LGRARLVWMRLSLCVPVGSSRPSSLRDPVECSKSFASTSRRWRRPRSRLVDDAAAAPRVRLLAAVRVRADGGPRHVARVVKSLLESVERRPRRFKTLSVARRLAQVFREAGALACVEGSTGTAGQAEAEMGGARPAGRRTRDKGGAARPAGRSGPAGMAEEGGAARLAGRRREERPGRPGGGSRCCCCALSRVAW
jgi:hypothetical protein